MTHFTKLKKSNMYRIFFCLSFTFLTISVFAKPPGYKGKRLLFQYQPSFNLNPQGVSKEDPEESIFYIPKINHGAYIEYVMGRRTSFGTKIAYSQNYLNYRNVLDYNYDPLVSLSDYGFEFLIKHYRYKGGNLAPFGTYTQFGFGKHLFNVKNVKFDEVLYSNYNLNSLSLGWGKQRVIFKTMVLDMNLKFTAVIPLGTPNGSNVNSKIINLTNNNIIYQNIVGINIGLGFLAPRLQK